MRKIPVILICFIMSATVFLPVAYAREKIRADGIVENSEWYNAEYLETNLYPGNRVTGQSVKYYIDESGYDLYLLISTSFRSVEEPVKVLFDITVSDLNFQVSMADARKGIASFSENTDPDYGYEAYLSYGRSDSSFEDSIFCEAKITFKNGIGEKAVLKIQVTDDNDEPSNVYDYTVVNKAYTTTLPETEAEPETTKQEKTTAEKTTKEKTTKEKTTKVSSGNSAKKDKSETETESKTEKSTTAKKKERTTVRPSYSSRLTTKAPKTTEKTTKEKTTKIRTTAKKPVNQKSRKAKTTEYFTEEITAEAGSSAAYITEEENSKESSAVSASSPSAFGETNVNRASFYKIIVCACAVILFGTVAVLAVRGKPASSDSDEKNDRHGEE